jgi:Cu+-exporting ATPase
VHREFQPELMRGNHQTVGPHDHYDQHEHDHASELRALVATTLVVGVLLGLDVAFGLWGLESYRRPYGISLALLAAVIGGGRVVYLALSALLEGRIGADIALAIACIAAGLLGEYFVAAEVVFIALVGECLEAFTFERAQRAIESLLEYRPRTARVVRGDDEVEVPADSLVVGDRLVVRPGERIAADGVVVAGRSAVDQAVLTGESLPVDKGEGDAVFTGTVNQFGRLEVRAEKIGTATTLGQVIRLLADARRKKSPLERAADRYARLFLPAVLSAAGVVFLATNAGRLWAWRSGGGPTAIDLLPTLAVLVVACPCALILATPAAVLAASARLARRGVLVKGGAALERLARVDALAFDKTGTLTEGKPEIGDLLAFESWNPADVLRFAAAAEQSSEHPLARLLVAEARERSLELPTAVDFQAQPGAGICANLKVEADTRPVLVGNLRLFRERGIEITGAVQSALEELDASGQTALLVAVDGRLVGAIGARDRVRIEAHDVIHDLKYLGLKDLTILTGDRPAPARAVAKRVHVKQVESELTPTDKAEWVQRRQHEGRVVAMIGDGVNDAPALATADVGLALGGVGADIAAEAGSVVLMGDPLEPLPEAVRVARQTVRVIRQNILVFAFGLNGVAVLLAGLRVLGPVAAAVLHQVGSLLVLLNAIRLLGFERWGRSGLARAATRAIEACRECRPSRGLDWIWIRRKGLLRWAGAAAGLAYLASGITVIGSAEVGALRRWGKFQAPLLGPGLHLRFPPPIERVIKVEPDLIRVARFGVVSSGAGGPIAWSASHGARRDESALFFTGDESLVELAGVVEYRLTQAELPALLFGVASVEAGVASATEGVLREAIARTALDDILAARRGPVENAVENALRSRLAATGLCVQLDHVRIIDAHPPREVVPAFRDVSAAVSDAARYRNEAEAYAAGREWAAKSEAQAKRDEAAGRANRLERRAEGERRAFLAQTSAHSARPELTEFRLLWNTLATAYAARPKIVLDPKAGGRRHVWLADPDKLGPGLFRAAGADSPPRIVEPED